MIGIHRSPVDSPHKGPVSWKEFPCDSVVMALEKVGWNLSFTNIIVADTEYQIVPLKSFYKMYIRSVKHDDISVTQWPPAMDYSAFIGDTNSHINNNTGCPSGLKNWSTLYSHPRESPTVVELISACELFLRWGRRIFKIVEFRKLPGVQSYAHTQRSLAILNASVNSVFTGPRNGLNA